MVSVDYPYLPTMPIYHKIKVHHQFWQLLDHFPTLSFVFFKSRDQKKANQLAGCYILTALLEYLHFH